MDQRLSITERDMQDYYRRYRNGKDTHPHWRACAAAMAAMTAELPRPDALTLRRRLYREIVKHGEPKIFRGSPFFFELGMRPSENWGTPEAGQPAGWLLRHAETDAAYKQRGDNLWKFSSSMGGGTEPVLWLIYNREGFDVDHHCFGFRRVVPEGTRALLARIEARAADPALTPKQRAELAAMREGVEALETAAARFREAALAQLAAEHDPEERANLERIAATAAVIVSSISFLLAAGFPVSMY